jgi:hypothetical protein
VSIASALREIVVEILFRDLEYLVDRYMTDTRKVRGARLFELYYVVAGYIAQLHRNGAVADDVVCLLAAVCRASAACIGTTRWTPARDKQRRVKEQLSVISCCVRDKSLRPASTVNCNVRHHTHLHL